MTTTVCFTAKNISYLKGGGHFWVPLNWALGLRALGCDVIWLEPIDPSTPVEEVWTLTKLLKERLEPYGLRDRVALSSITGEPLDPAAVEGCLDIDAASELSTLLVNLRYDLPAEQVERFSRSALLDIDPRPVANMDRCRALFARSARSVFYYRRNGGNAWCSLPIRRARVALHAATCLSAAVAACLGGGGRLYDGCSLVG